MNAFDTMNQALAEAEDIIQQADDKWREIGMKYGEPWKVQDDGWCNEADCFEYQERAVQCVNACAGIENPEEAIREAREMLEHCYRVHNAITIYTPRGHQDKEANREHCDNIKAALAKLQPKQAE